MIAIGKVLAVHAAALEVRLPFASIGEGVCVHAQGSLVRGEVSGVMQGRAIVLAHDPCGGVRAGDEAVSEAHALCAPLGMQLLGRCVDARGCPIDGGRAVRAPLRPLAVSAPHPHERAAIDDSLWTGVRAIDALLTIGRGARIGIFGPPGAGKSTLLHAIARGTYADAIVIGLIGERGREAEEWMRAAPRHAAIVCATSDRSAPERIRAARLAIAQAHALRSRGLHVLLILDSVARYAGALREVALARGETAGRAGYPPGVFAQLAASLEVAGAMNGGSITLVATVLSDGDERDPVSDAARSLLDGHIQLSSSLAAAGRFPAIDVPLSASRTMNEVVSARHRGDAALVHAALASLAETADARRLGMQPVEAQAAKAAAAEPALVAFLRQDGRPEDPAATLSQLAALADTLR